jgi:predicted Zn-dependent peptidase
LQPMKHSAEYRYFTLQNGIRIVYGYSNSPIVHLGLFINTGTRDETLKEHGMAHFIEHVIFKGTRKRKSYQIYNCIENVGGELNAFTTKEDTCIHASFLTEYFERSAELISDVVFNSVFPEKELEKEKEIIIDEIFYYKDIPEETIFEDFEEMVFAGHPLGRNILGEKNIIQKFTKEDIENFIRKNYRTERMVLSIVGNLDFDTMLSILKKHFERIMPYNIGPVKRKSFNNYVPVQKVIKKEIFQSHCIMGNTAYSYNSKQKLGLTLINNLLGGPSSNAILNMSVREKHGLTYNIESNYAPYFDSGIFSIYVSADNDAIEKVMSLIFAELKKLREHKMGALQLSRAKRQLSGNLALAYESKIAEMLSIGKTYLIFDRVDSMAEINKKIEKITAEELFDIANLIFDTNHFTQLIYRANGSYKSEDI